ncbi:MAG TPA: XdhC family protein [Gemmatimonadota bacterium]|nr:XdhC family protein [Gemmatimonadota bacterium]
MTEGLDLARSARLALAALEGKIELALAVVIESPDEPDLLGRRLAWDGERLHGTLGDAARDETVRRLLEAAEGRGTARVQRAIELYVERVAPPAELVVVGAGHIAQPLSRIGALLGFRVTVVDDRPDFARRDRFPDADRVVVADFADPFAGISIGPRSYVVLVTRGHRYDFDCVRALARAGAEPAYVGMIGSRRRVRAAFEQLAAEGFDEERLARIHAPIGLDIGAETPAEIAVAIAAEMILAARGGTGEPLGERSNVVRYVKALATVAAAGRSAEPEP